MRRDEHAPEPGRLKKSDPLGGYRIALFLFLLLPGTGWNLKAATGSGNNQSRKLERGRLEIVASPGDAVREATPEFPNSDRLQVRKALLRARQIYRQHRDAIDDFLEMFLEGQATPDEIHFFQSAYRDLLMELRPGSRVYDGRRSKFALPRNLGMVHAYFRNHRYPVDAIVTEASIGKFVIFLGFSFFKKSLDAQARVILHEALHLLGAGFTDADFEPVLRQFRWYDPSRGSSQNLYEFFERACR